MTRLIAALALIASLLVSGRAYAHEIGKTQVSATFERGTYQLDIVVDPATDTVVGRYPVAGCKENHGMAIDPERRRAFLSCEGNDALVVFNLDTKKVIATLPMAKGADVVQFDPGLGRIYVARGSGAISVFQMDDPDRFRKVEDVRVPKKVHSLVVDVKTHRVYAPAEEENGRPVAKMLVFEAIPGASNGATGK